MKNQLCHKVIFYFLIKAYCPKVPRLFLYLFPFALFRGKETVKKNLSCLFDSKNLHPLGTESRNVDKRPSFPSLIFLKLQICILLLCSSLSATNSACVTNIPFLSYGGLFLGISFK